MAVAVKNTPDVDSASLLDRMAIASLAGAAYVLGTLGIVFYLIPSLWQSLGWSGSAALLLRGVVQLAAVSGLLVLGVRMLGPKTSPGVRAGIAISLLGVLLILLLTRWASLWIEYWSYDRGLFGPSTGAILTAVLGLALLALGIRFFLRPGTERFLVRLEEQGWFHARPYKAMQGSRVRRGTIVGILVLIGAGIWTMLSHGTLRRGSPDWQLDVPFTGKVTIEWRGDVPDQAFADVLNGRIPDWQTRLADRDLVLDRFTLQEINRKIDPERHVKIIERGATNFETNQVVSKSEYDAAIKKLEETDPRPLTATPQPASGPVRYSSLTLLPAVQFTIPLLMLAAGLWLAWRIVNVPAFADFLIATEAEMNKVSWTTQRRLVQDTIVVLVTVILMAFYLFSMDVVWKSVLSWPRIGVLKVSSDSQREQAQPSDDRPY